MTTDTGFSLLPCCAPQPPLASVAPSQVAASHCGFAATATPTVTPLQVYAFSALDLAVAASLTAATPTAAPCPPKHTLPCMLTAAMPPHCFPSPIAVVPPCWKSHKAEAGRLHGAALNRAGSTPGPPSWLHVLWQREPVMPALAALAAGMALAFSHATLLPQRGQWCRR